MENDGIWEEEGEFGKEGTVGSTRAVGDTMVRDRAEQPLTRAKETSVAAKKGSGQATNLAWFQPSAHDAFDP